jgi:RNA polymerase sigma-70 factor (ECF subfamily)
MVIRRIPAAPPAIPRLAGSADVPDWNDTALLAALANNDPRAGLVLYDRLIRIVEWTILRITGQRLPDHEDLVQTAFEQIVITLYRKRYAQSCSLTSWASALSCHVALNAVRSQRRHKALHVETAAAEREPAARVDLESQLDARQTLERVRAALARMNAGRAEVLVLHEVNGLELSDIARVLGISVAAAQSRLSRGRRELSERLAAPGGETP